MKYQCNNPECRKQFMHVATHKEFEKVVYNGENNLITPAAENEIPCCPYCKSSNYDEIVVEVVKPVPEEIESVYIYELTTGKQEELDNKLAEGYKIVGRFAKQYHLEKPKIKLTAIDGNLLETKSSVIE
jgi:hypothetical protein